MKTNVSPSLVSTWKLSRFCEANGIHPENLSDFADATTRMLTKLNVGHVENNRLIPVVVKDSRGYRYSEDQDEKELTGISYCKETTIPCYSAAEMGYADSVELWIRAGVGSYMAARLLKDPKINNEFFCLTRYSVFFELPAEQAWFLVDFIKNNTKLNSLLGVYQ